MLVYDQYIYPEKPDTDEDIIVFHSGFCSTTPNYSYGRDTRDYYLIHYVTRGRGTYQAGASMAAEGERRFSHHSGHDNRTYGG